MSGCCRPVTVSLANRADLLNRVAHRLRTKYRNGPSRHPDGGCAENPLLHSSPRSDDTAVARLSSNISHVATADFAAAVNFTVIVPDLPGIGYFSPANSLVSETGIDRCVYRRNLKAMIGPFPARRQLKPDHISSWAFSRPLRFTKLRSF
jgi:hypothetical protein